ncbi:hypothetical protein LGH70_23320 [Hymenobacter sp. BT635]|uniref:Uncharacterized protein n=1 Tax=Hymenobacter nitidus TaxID=2880929 RepID=A0ABS8ANI7_9BACT|nr:hypothetical protein [Hymenobacter nitidus]MCB2380544.1 hypothetical protein [Hymenobacter nitidus]
MARAIEHTTLNDHTAELLEKEAVPFLVLLFRNVRGTESNLVEILAGGLDIVLFHQPDNAAYSFRVWLNNPVWNRADTTPLATFLGLIAERLSTDKNLQQQFIADLLRAPAYYSDSLRPWGDEEGRLFPQFNLGVELR